MSTCLHLVAENVVSVSRVADANRNRNNPTRKSKKHSSQDRVHSDQPYCTMACIRGMMNMDSSDQSCPNLQYHGKQRHQMGQRRITNELHCQILEDRNKGFEPLHICGRTGYLVKATLLSHGYTVVIKATTKKKKHTLQTEYQDYRQLRSLQGYQIPICLGHFEPSMRYWYHGELMAHMMILGWSGALLRHIIATTCLEPERIPTNVDPPVIESIPLPSSR